MAKAKAAKPAARKPAGRRAKYIWHIFRFQERFELSDDVRYCRRSPLLFTRDFVGSGQDDEAISYQQQMNVLKTRDNRLVLRGAFHELKEIAANRSRCYRGYLLDERFRPATERKISQWLNVDIKLARKILKDLADIGLIERVPVPQFDPTVNDPPEKKPKAKDEPAQPGRKPVGRKPKPSKNAGQTRGGGSKNAAIPGATGNAGNSTEAFTRGNGNGKNENGNSEVQSESEKGKTGKKRKKEKAQAAPVPGKRKKLNPPSTPSDNPKAKAKQKNNAQLKLHRNTTPEGTGEEKRTTSSPATTHPTFPSIPTVSDAGGGKGDSESNPTKPPHVGSGSFVNRVEKLYDSSCQEFAGKIYRELRIPHEMDSTVGRQELGNFATAWSLAQVAGLQPAQLATLWDKSVKEAKAIGLKYKRGVKFTKGPGAVWRSIFNKRLAARVGEMKEAV